MSIAFASLAIVVASDATPPLAIAHDQPGAARDHATSRAVVANGEVVIHEPGRPVDVLKSFSGTCGGDRYEISIQAGLPLADAVRFLQVNGEEYRHAAVRAIAGHPIPDGRVIDAKIAECGDNSAKVRFMIPSPDHLRQLHSYDLWIHDDGRTEFIGER